MAIIPPDGTIQVVQIGRYVAIIKDGGKSSEQVYHRIFPGHQQALFEGQLKVLNDGRLTDEQKFYISFWLGYFYAFDLHAN